MLENTLFIRLKVSDHYFLPIPYLHGHHQELLKVSADIALNIILERLVVFGVVHALELCHICVGSSNKHLDQALFQTSNKKKGPLANLFLCLDPPEMWFVLVLPVMRSSFCRCCVVVVCACELAQR